MKHNINKEHEDLFYAISNICGTICRQTNGSEFGGAYDLARRLQLDIMNVLGQNEDDDGSLIWKV